MMGRRDHFLLACSVAALASGAEAGETITYTYDALGRLIATTSDQGTSTGVGYDRAGNRTTYDVTGVPTPPPPPPGPAGTLSGPGNLAGDVISSSLS